MNHRFLSMVVALGMLTGCMARFYDHREFVLDVGEISTFVVDGISRKRVLRVMGAATGGKVDVYVFLEENQAEVERLLTLGKGARLMITGVEKTNELGLVAPIPADKTAIVLVRNMSSQPAEVDLKMSD